MIQRIFLLAILSLPALAVSAQKKKSKKDAEANVLPPPRVWIANIPAYATSYDMIMANPLLTTDSPGCKVSLFSISMSIPDGTFYGPMHCVGNTMNETQRAAIERWKDKKNITLHVQDIHLNCHETDATSPALKYTYNTDPAPGK
ncbi:hypothetical protein GCM10023093_20680 [Nemorincola caseinilytica]|uniref:Uncharacterized protein n=1 Tax=Nemorincola caseinilytica TaxID=2054315 RepID=A0ABP8NJB2_9BACT